MITIEPAAQAHRAAVKTMLHDYLHELGATTEYPYLDLYWSEDGRFPYLIRNGSDIAGFALVRMNERGVFEMAEFGVRALYRRVGAGRAATAAVLAMHPGEWEIRSFPGNGVSARFWERVTAQYAPTVHQSLDGSTAVFGFSFQSNDV